MDASPRTDPYEHPEFIGRYRVKNLLGKGTFGSVYLADDPLLQRQVAIKVPHRALVASPEDAEAYLKEARIVAKLRHEHIVAVYDVGHDDVFPCFFVLEYIKGGTLVQRIKADRPLVAETLELVITVAGALHHAHKGGIVHRDVKPGNNLLDERGPVVGDFGLALREQDLGRGPQFAGTLAYMSPEQARCEGHRVDGRSDIFSLGIVFYELLTGHRPFHGDSRSELVEQITKMEVRPPRQWDDGIPKELERICLKALAKRQPDRYATAQDMADDLRSFLEQATLDGDLVARSAVNAAAEPAPVPAPVPAAGPGSAQTSEQHPCMIVPKGLRSFDAHDAVFFLELLPGARDRRGLPDSIRFWKNRIEEREADSTFTVGLIYGPSGCGKSSFVKAGLLPRLSSDVITVYVEATADETEARLLNGLRKKCPGLSDDLPLIETLTGSRQGHGLPPHKKLLIVLDQFEQWLHARKGQEDTELVRALRQCDGARVQCIVMVRDDFWLAVCRFLQELEVRLVEGQNSALVDLFPLHHAKNVLGAYGRAYGVLPERMDAITREQKQFLEQAVKSLTQDNKVICVRLALFAEMMKSRAWTPAAMKEVGGAEGVGVAFLEETFAASTAPPHHRYHQSAARAVLKALLPEAGTDIKGHMKSAHELLEASGYVHHPKDFEELLRILDSELRLITPMDPEGVDSFSHEPSASPGAALGAQSALAGGSRPNDRSYQLTHDYLVPSLRDWLTRKQKETVTGRTELLLADRAAFWAARSENRQLPSLLQWLRIRLLTAKTNWNASQRRMMARASRYYLSRGAVAAVCLLLLVPLGREGFGSWKAHELCRHLQRANAAEVPVIVDELSPYRHWANPLLRDAYADARKQGDAPRQLRASLALLPVDPEQANYLHERLLDGNVEEVAVIGHALAGQHVEQPERLWATLRDASNNPDQRFRAACALALFAPDDRRWLEVCPDIAAKLIEQKSSEIARWAELLKPVARWMVERLADESEADASADATIASADRKANIGVALMDLGRDEVVWPMLKHRSDPTLRSYLIDRLCQGGADRDALFARLKDEPQPSIRIAILLALGKEGRDGQPPTAHPGQVLYLLDLLENDPDHGIHSAADWALRRLQANPRDLKRIEDNLAERGPDGKHDWYVNREGQTLLIVSPSGEFMIGEGEHRQRVRIDRKFALAATDVTVEQFRRFRKDFRVVGSPPGERCPINWVTWYEAAAYCNWLSKQDDIPHDQWCYVPNDQANFADGMRMAENYLHKTGYRLPTGAEWEYACRAGADCRYNFGRDWQLLDRYAWFSFNSPRGVSHPVAELRPNDFGLFDMHGNIRQWVQERAQFRAQSTGEDQEDKQDIEGIHDNGGDQNEGAKKYWRISRGSSFVDHGGQFDPGSDIGFFLPTVPSQYIGFRPARTILDKNKNGN